MPKVGRIDNVLICNQLQEQRHRLGRALKQTDALKLCAVHPIKYVEVNAGWQSDRHRPRQLRIDLLLNSLHGRTDLNHH